MYTMSVSSRRKGAEKSTTLREQAAELLKAGLWGIGARTANRDKLAPGDDVLIFVGAPESAFIGHARLAEGTHEWTAEEANRYPGDWNAGVSFQQESVWNHPVPIQSILSGMALGATNPQARFFGGVVRITKTDFDLVLAASGSAAPPLAEQSGPEQPIAHQEDSPADRVFEATESLKQLVQQPTAQLSEYDTRALLIDRYLNALGYVGLEDVRRGSPVDSGTFPDYVLNVLGKPAIALEARGSALLSGRRRRRRLSRTALVSECDGAQ